MKTLMTLSLLIMIACNPKESELVFRDHSVPKGTISDSTGSEAYSELKTSILPKCVHCHSNLETEEGVQKWIVPGKPHESKLFVHVEDGSMPADGDALTTQELEIVRRYIISLTREAPEEENPSVITFENIKNEVLLPHRCLQCHKKMDNEEALKVWIDQGSPDNSKLLVRVLDGSMPKNGPAVPEDKIELLKQYVGQFAN